MKIQLLSDLHLEANPDFAPSPAPGADLLVCEHLAGQVLTTHLGIRAATSRVHHFGGRTFLEVERFDRHGLYGRSGVTSLASLNGALFGLAGVPWVEVARQLGARAWLPADDVRWTALLWCFGQLIGNNDMHDGNLSFQPRSVDGRPGLQLALSLIHISQGIVR